MIPVLTLLGASKVGKSTLFKRLFFKKNNLIKNIYKNYSICCSEKFIYLLIDTNSVSYDFVFKNYLNFEFKLNSIIFESDIILFIVDTESFCSYINLLLSNFLRKIKKYIFLVINKFDNNKYILDLNFLKKLGLGKPYFISALHNYNVNNFINNILNLYCLNKDCLIKDSNCLDNYIFSILGKENVGKSSFLRSLLKNNLLNLSLFSEKFFIYLKYKNFYFVFINIFFKLNYNLKKIFFLKIFKNISISNVVLFIIDPIQKISYIDNKIYNIIYKRSLKVIFIINKSDILSIKERIFFKKFVKKKFNLINFYILFISSIFKFNIVNVKYVFKKIHYFSFINFNTYKLNKIFLKYSKFLKLYYNYNTNIKYIHQGGSNPILIIIHGKKIKFKNCYKKFLKKIFYNKLNIRSVFLKIKI